MMKKEDMRPELLFDLSHTAAAGLFAGLAFPWEALAGIGRFIEELGSALSAEEYESPAAGIWIHRTARVAPTACVTGPVIIGPGTEVRHCAFIRGRALIGRDCVIGNSTELKNVILFDRVQVPHYNYVGDSILGYRAHMGAGSITSNVRSDRALIRVHAADRDIETGLKKFGAMIGDGVEVGCGTVLNPGAVIGRNASIYPLSSVRGAVDAESIYKRQGEVVCRRPET